MFLKTVQCSFITILVYTGSFSQSLGLELVKDINPGPPSSTPQFQIELNGNMILKAYDGIHGSELWASNGTEEGTYLIKDINPGNNSSLTHHFKEFNDKIYFIANDGVHGKEIWVTDATEAGTYLLKDINPGVSDAFYYVSGNYNGPYFTELNNKLYFVAFDGQNGNELWVTDGTEAGTHMLKDINPSGNGIPNIDPYFNLFNGKLYFRANDGVHGIELWMTDGTEAGTQMVKDINPGTSHGMNPSSPYLINFITYNGDLYFMANDGETGYELWKTNGTEVGTQLVKNINPGIADSRPSSFILFNEKIYFSAATGYNNRELWMTDGTEPGTQLVKEINPGAAGSFPWSFTIFNEKLFFYARTAMYGRELWMSDGTTNGTEIFIDIEPFNGTDYSPRIYLNYNGKLYFSADDGVHGEEMWATDGTIEGTFMLKDIIPEEETGYYMDPVSYNGKLYFNVFSFDTEGIISGHLWETDGTPDGTVIITPSDAEFDITMIEQEPVVFQNNLYFYAQYYENIGSELYRFSTPLDILTHDFINKSIIHPNPVDQILYISTADIPNYIIIYTMSGQKVLESKWETHDIAMNVSFLPSGLYIVELSYSSTKETLKFIKK